MNAAMTSWFRLIPGLLLWLVSTTVGCGNSDHDVSREPLLLLGAFPAERAALVDRATIDEVVTVEGHVFRRGKMAGAPVIIAMTGIGLVNAANTTRLALEAFPVSGVVMSGVAGSPRNIADVVVPDTWTLPDESRFTVDADWLALARLLAENDVTEFERCTDVVTPPEGGHVCLPNQPTLTVGGLGRSSDPFDGAFACQMNDDEVFGCDVFFGLDSFGSGAVSTSDLPIAEDMESAAVAREAAAAGQPFIAFRAVSDGNGDPLGLPGFPAQFFAYYPLAADNAAAAVQAFVEELVAR